MGKKTVIELYLEIVKLKENHETEFNVLKKNHEDLKEAFDALSEKYGMSLKKVNVDVKKCPECEVTFRSERELKNHVITHRSNGTYKCDKCERIFDEEWKLNAHLKMHGEISCEQCEKTFKCKEIFEKHFKIAHEGIKLYCHYYNNEEECPFAHNCIFLHENSPQCMFGKLCERIKCMFKHKSSDKHVSDNDDEKNELDTADESVICDNCDFIAADDISLEVHNVRKHGGYFDCPFCHHRLKDEEDFNTHLHTCESYICEVCEPKFMLKLSDLISHLSSKHTTDFKNVNIIHLKMDRHNFDKVSRRIVSSEYFTRQA